MKRGSFLFALSAFLLLAIPPATRAQADIALPTALAGVPYSQPVGRALRDNYGIELPVTSDGPAYEWTALGPWPRGLSVDRRTGTVFGTPAAAKAQTHRFLVQVADRSTTPAAATRYWLVLKVVPAERQEDTAHALRRPEPAQPEPVINQETKVARVRQSDDAEIEIPSIVPRKDLVLPITIKDPTIRKLEILVLDKDEKRLGTYETPDNLTRGEVRTSVTVQLAEGRNTIHVRDADTKEPIKSLLVTLKPTDKDDAPQKPALQIRHSGFVSEEAKDTAVTFFVGDPKIQKIRVTVTDKDGKESAPKDIELKRSKDEYPEMVKLGGGKNVIKVSDADPASKIVPVTMTIERDKAVKEEKPKEEPVEIAPSRLVAQDAAFAPLAITVNKPEISRIKVRVYGSEKDKKDGTWKANDKHTFESEIIALQRGEDTVYETVNLAPGDLNLVKVFDVSKGDIKEGDAELQKFEIKRGKGREEKTAFHNVQSLNTRAIVGFEQAGASAASSEGKPFLDFFFTAPLRYKPYDDDLPRAAVWGNIRLASIPQQVSTFGTFGTNFVDPLAENKLNTLVQGFDFLVGPEIRLFGSNKASSGVIPGVRQRTKVYFAAGFGAISPLSTDRGSVDIRQTPAANSPQREEFLNLFPGAKDKKYIAFVFPDRDRFLRQYYAGLRLKTHFYDDAGLINRFPAMFDIMFGQNEAVTGGRLKNVIMKLEGFYPFPVRGANFLYLYGTAMMKLGGGVRISTPLFLDTADSTVQITNTDLFIAPTLQSDKDYYRIGIGVNLTELFGRKPPPPVN
jgi:hypothetical protein